MSLKVDSKMPLQEQMLQQYENMVELSVSLQNAGRRIFIIAEWLRASMNKVEQRADNTGSPKLLADTIEKYYEAFIYDDGVDEVTASGAQEFRDFICQQLRAGA